MFESRIIDIQTPHWEALTVKMSELSDESELINLGFNEQEYHIRSYQPTYYAPSLMNEFPNNYKIIGTGLFASANKSLIQRADTDILLVFGDVGGMAAFLGLVLKFFVEQFGHL